MVDQREIKIIQEWLNATEKDFSKGVELLFRINRNVPMMQYLMRKKDEGKLTYELNKHLNIFLDGMTRRDVIVMEQEVMPQIAKTVEKNAMPAPSSEQSETKSPMAKYHGKRQDHDSLPNNIKEIYEKNGEIFFKIKNTYNNLLRMQDAMPCDRYEYLKILIELDKEYRDNWAKYDGFVSDDTTASPNQTSTLTPKQISAARKFVSENRKKLTEMPPGDKKDILFQKMQARISLLVNAGETFDDEYQASLEALGLQFAS